MTRPIHSMSTFSPVVLPALFLAVDVFGIELFGVE
jgi:hypothetical protein